MIPRWLSRRLPGSGAPPRPVLLRVVDADGRPVPKVQVSGYYWPRLEPLDAHRTTDSGGTCVLQWVKGAERMSLTVRHGDSEADAEIAIDRPDPERVVQVVLHPRAVASGC